MNFVLYFLAQFGFAYIVGFSKISIVPRELIAPTVDELSGEPNRGLLNLIRYWLISLIECPACLGFWAGGFTGPWLVELGAAKPPLGPFWLFVFFGCVVSGANFVLARVTRLI